MVGVADDDNCASGSKTLSVIPGDSFGDVLLINGDGGDEFFWSMEDLR